MSTMNRLILLIQVSRPILWPVLPLVYWLGMHSADAPMTWVASLQMASLSLPLCLVGCGWNDIYDYESDRHSQRRRYVWGAVLHAEDRPLVWWACVIASPLIVAVACLTRDWLNIGLTAFLVWGTWAYSVPPLRLKEWPPLDSLSNGLGFFLIPFTLGFSMGADPRNMALKYYLLALCVAGVHALAAAADFDADRTAGHRTLAVAYGRRAAAAFACATFVITLLLADFHGTSVRVYVALGAIVTFTAAVVPTYRTIAAACVVVFAGFLVAGVCHLWGW
jgi:4-hydroxybenzoate polyprenyltransferase